MRTIKEIKKDIRQANKDYREAYERMSALQSELYRTTRDTMIARIEKRYKTGNVYIRVDGLTNYHCDPLIMYEFQRKSGKDGFHARIFKLRYADGDWWTSILFERVDYATLDDMPKMKKLDNSAYAEVINILVNEPEKGEAWIKRYKEANAGKK